MVILICVWIISFIQVYSACEGGSVMGAALKPCPCGKVPDGISLPLWQPQDKWTYGACPCGEWEYEFRADYEQDEIKVRELAAEAWNALPRKEVSDGC